MKKTIIMAVTVIFAALSTFAQDVEKEKKDIKNVIQTAYVDGLQNKGNVEDIKDGFHPGFNLLGVKDDKLTKYPIYSWIQSFEERKAKDPSPVTDEKKITCNYLLIDVTGNSAMAKIQLLRNKELIFTDYLQLYKFEDGWKIVSKVYYRH